MPLVQSFFIVLTFVVPFALWWLSRRRKSELWDRFICRALAAALLLTYLGDLAIKLRDSDPILRYALPMQLCDWVLFAVVLALARGSQTGFELAYFWGLGGTIQALFTPAIDANIGPLRLFGFFLAHSLIVVGVLYLMFARRFRPTRSSLLRVVIWSEIYLALALTVNALTGANYGFLRAKPVQGSMLDLFSDTPWLYVLGLNLCALLFYAVLYLPWLIAERFAAKAPAAKVSASPPS